ncbi:MAG TPA: DUF4097 family beta strand repeat-containing protein [Vicinamibacterales bacterium]|nr:DUF4097 family beta strand repeat-containing protein [Vicinamibacterales bacterium]
MSIQRISRVAAGVLWLAAGVVPVAHADSRYVTREEKSFTVSGTPEVTLNTFDGRIEVRSWDKNEVHVTIERRAASEAEAKGIQVDVRQDGNQVTVEVRKPTGDWFSWFGRSRSANLIVSVPRSSTLSAGTGDGSIDVGGINGAVKLHSGDGSIDVNGVKGDLEATTGDGSIRIDGLDGALRARSGDGSVRASGRVSAVEVRSGDGSVSVNAEPGSSMTSDWSVVSGDGSITLGLPSDFNAEVDAHTGDGSVSINGLALKVSGTLRRNTIRGTLGNGGRQLTIRSGDGSIILNSR